MSEASLFDPTPLKVLVVGDNAFERRLVMDLLIALGVRTILSADDAVAAFAQMTLKKPDIVIADAEMAPFSGFMLAREIRSAPMERRDVPIVLFTTESSPDFIDMARAAGVNEVLTKPVSALALRRSLEEAGQRPHTFQRPPPGPSAEPRPPMQADRRSRRAPNRLALDVRTSVFAAIDEARLCAARWADTGEPAMVEATGAAITRAIEAAQDGGGDPALTQALTGAQRLAGAAGRGLADPRLLDVSLSAARAVLAAPAARNAMRQALAEAVFDAARAKVDGLIKS